MTTLTARPASLSSSWDDVKKHAAPLALALLVTIVLAALDTGIFYLVSSIFTALFGGEYSDVGPLVGSTFGYLARLPVYILACMSGMLINIIPALYFGSGAVVSFSSAVEKIKGNFLRYFLAGLFFNVIVTVGFVFCVLRVFMIIVFSFWSLSHCLCTIVWVICCEPLRHVLTSLGILA